MSTARKLDLPLSEASANDCDPAGDSAFVAGELPTITGVRAEGSGAGSLVMIGPAGKTVGAPDDRSELGLERGDCISRYTLIRKLGSGGMGEVWLGFDPDLARRVALKFLRPRATEWGAVLPESEAALDSGTEQQRGALLEEARAMGRVVDGNVVAVYDAGIAGELIFLAMEFVDGASLLAWRGDARRTWREVTETMLGAARGLWAAHRAGILHRDFKPANILVDQSGLARVADFGLAAAFDGSANTECIAGTPAYMAPELWVGAGASEATEVFAFCVSLFELVHGHRPYQGRSPDRLIAAIKAGEVEACGRDVPRWLDDLLMRGLAVEPGKRPASMAQVVGELELGLADVRARWWGPVIVALALVVLAVVYGLARDQSVGSGPCANIAHRAERIWNEGLRRELHAHIEAEAATGDRAGLVDLLRGFGRERSDWVDAWEQLCGRDEGAEVAGLAFDEGAACLERRAGAWQGAHGIFLRSAPPVLKKMSGMMAAMHRSSDCLAPGQAGAGLLPPDPAMRAEVLKLRMAGDRVRMLGRAGDLKAARTVLPGLISSAVELDYKPLFAELLFLSGQMSYLSFDPRTALRELRAAVRVATAADHLEISARSRLLALFVEGYLLREVSELDERIAASEAAVERAGASPGLLGTFFDRQGPALVMAGRLEDAEAAFRAAVLLKREAFGANSVPVSGALNNLARVLTTRGAYAEAEQLFRQVLAIERRVVGPRTPNAANALTNLGIAIRRQGRYVQALAHFQASRGMISERLGPTSRRLIWPTMEEARVRSAMGDMRGANQLYAACYRDSVRVFGRGDRNLSGPLHGLFDTALATGQMEAAAGYLRQLDQLPTATGGHAELERGRRLVHAARLAIAQEQFLEAAEGLGQAASALADVAAEQSSELCHVRLLQAELALRLGQPQRALTYFNIAKAQWQATMVDDIGMEARLLLVRTQLDWTAPGDGSSAVTRARRALRLAQKALPANAPVLWRFRVTLARSLALAGQLTAAQTEFDRAMAGYDSAQWPEHHAGDQKAAFRAALIQGAQGVARAPGPG